MGNQSKAKQQACITLSACNLKSKRKGGSVALGNQGNMHGEYPNRYSGPRNIIEP